MISSTLKEKIESLPAILSIQETADFFSTQPLTVYRLIYREKLPAWKDDEGNWCVARYDLERFCSNNSNL
ncbi:MAG: helix-turn-helix domain-containing protein [Treponema sp.]|jgi:hypothetical protein|nr:helix-turn-helix domain-containing protein [Treponema sp.]